MNLLLYFKNRWSPWALMVEAAILALNYWVFGKQRTSCPVSCQETFSRQDKALLETKSSPRGKALWYSWKDAATVDVANALIFFRTQKVFSAMDSALHDHTRSPPPQVPSGQVCFRQFKVKMFPWLCLFFYSILLVSEIKKMPSTFISLFLCCKHT